MVEVWNQGESRFKVLLTENRPHAPEDWIRQVPQLLQPQGVTAYLASTGREAIQVAETTRIHLAVIDLGTPVDRPGLSDRQPKSAAPGGTLPGFWLLELLRRLPNRPPTVLLSCPSYGSRDTERILAQCLKLGVFSVVNKPVQTEQFLTVLRRLIDRQYRGHWPNRT